MTNWNKIVSAGMITIIAIILCIPMLLTGKYHDFLFTVFYCIVEGVIVLMFSREIRGEFYG